MNALRARPWLMTLGVLVILCIISVILQPNFFSARIVKSNLTTFLPLVLVAIGQCYVVLGGDIDLSVGSIVALVNVVTVSVIAAFGGEGAIFIGMAAGMATGLVAGLFNGVMIAALRLQPIVTTFATGIIFAAIAIWILPTAGLPVPASYWRSYGASVFGVPVVGLIMIAALVWAVVFARSRFHGHLLAVGGNRTGAFQSGLAVAALRIKAYGLSGIFAALAALCLTGETASGDPLLGQSLALSSISAVVLGGTALAGGAGTALGALIGALVLGLIGNVIFFAGLPFEYQTLVQGLIVLAALAGGVFVTRR